VQGMIEGNHCYCCVIFCLFLRSCWYVYWLHGVRVRLKLVSVESAWETSFR